MEPIFTLSFPEYKVVLKLLGLYKPKYGYSILLPLSRQQKGFDLLIYNLNKHRSASIQVKGSRSYDGHKNDPHDYNLWFKRFKYKEGMADFYILFSVYPQLASNIKRLDHSRNTSRYSYLFMLLKDVEMEKLLVNLKTKKGKRDNSFQFGFDSSGRNIFLTRGIGRQKEKPYNKYLLENRVDLIKKFLK